MGSLALPSSIAPHFSLPVSPPILKFRTKFKSKSKSKSKCNKKVQLTAVCCSSGEVEYGGWDDFGPSNSLKWKNGIVGDWLENWENDRGKSLIVMGFGVVFAWSVARPRALWWVCLPLSGFMLLLFFHDYTMQDDRSRSRSATIPNSNKIPSDHDRIRNRSSLSNQVAALFDVILNFLSLDKSAQETLPMHNDISFGEFMQYLKTLKAALPKSNKNTQQLESSTKELKLEPQIWRRILEEDELVGSDVSDVKLGYAFSKSSTSIAGAEDTTVGKSETLRKSFESGTKDLTTNGCSQQSSVTELGQDKLHERKTHSVPVESDHGQDREIDIVDSLRSRKGDNNQGEKWRRQISSQNSDECAEQDHCTTNHGYDREQFPHKDGSVFQQLGRSNRLEELGVEAKQRSAINRVMISQSAEHLDEEYTVKNLKRLDVLQNYTRIKSQALRNCDDVRMQSTGINQRVKNPLTSSGTENEDIVKEHGILETDKSSSICLNESNVLQNSLHLSEASKIEEPRTGIQGGSHESRCNSSDRYGEQDSVAENRSSVDDSDPDCYPQAAVHRTKVGANSRQSEHLESLEALNLPFLENLKEKNFQMCLDMGGILLKEAKKGLQGKAEVGDAESMLYEAADVFSTAAALNPSSLVAVGQWGNTLLVHGELKLKLSQKLRSLLQSRNDFLSKKGQRYQSDEMSLAMMERETVAESLHEVCEECEKLLVEAGRKYRKALMLDKYDVRSLYNWGLALCFRAQLFAGGGERALKNVDKIYLAAIDKFEAMMGISQSYAPDALFSWGLALRNRSRMRPTGSKERTRLLQQARQLFEDALKFNPNHAQAKTAAISCMDELKELEYALSQTRRQERLRPNVSLNMD